MPIQIDRMDTSIELTAPAAPAATGERRPTTTPEPAAQTALAELIGRVMTDELERFLRNRGI